MLIEEIITHAKKSREETYADDKMMPCTMLVHVDDKLALSLRPKGDEVCLHCCFVATSICRHLLNASRVTMFFDSTILKYPEMDYPPRDVVMVADTTGVVHSLPYFYRMGQQIEWVEPPAGWGEGTALGKEMAEAFQKDRPKTVDLILSLMHPGENKEKARTISGIGSLNLRFDVTPTTGGPFG